MRTDLHLFLGDREVDFNNDPKILFNFKITELQKPTITKNSWTKQITINSTPNNDDIFQCFWNLERTQNGVDFNPNVKTPFQLFINGSLVQKGYAKLDSVSIANHDVQYKISLFGGIGEFIYNLSYNQGSAEDKKTLASLIYVNGSIVSQPDLNYTINKDTINEAWETLDGSGPDKWKVLNFAPVLNGLPSDFDSQRILINNRGSAAVYQKYYSEDGGQTIYRPVYGGSQNASGYSLAESSEELTADEVMEFRSYLTRPVVNVRRVLEACFHPSNNGGYQVKLDTHFFNENNPYWTRGWMTLPMLRDLEVSAGESSEITGATIQNTSKNRKNVVFNASSLSQIDNVRLRINVGLNGSDITGSPTTLYTHYHWNSPKKGTLDTDYVRTYDYNGAAVFMLIGRDINGQICAQSDAYCLSSYAYNYMGGPISNGFKVDGYPEPKNIRYIEGVWKKISNKWRFCNRQGQQQDIEFSFPASAPIATLEIMTQTNAGEKIVHKVYGDTYTYNTPDISFVLVWPSEYTSENAFKTEAQVKAPRISTNFTYDITDFYAVAHDYEALFSNTYIPRDKALSTSFTPADFLLSYAHLFGLYIYQNPEEAADDPTTCPRGVIHIMDRDSWYNDTYLDINDRIDRGKTMSITPTLAGSKWYLFKNEPIESECGNNFQKTYGHTYGEQRISTNYNFDYKEINLYDSSVFRSGVMVREKDKYFSLPYKSAPVYTWNGMTLSLFTAGDNGWDSAEIEIPIVSINNKIAINILGYDGYDAMPKLQCHSEKNEGTDGEYVLLFYNDMINTIADYWITDDVLEMQTLNGNACWLQCNSGLDAAGNQIGIKRNALPNFTRDLIQFGLQEGYITNSWNFGHPQVIFSPNTYTTDGDSIYDKCWKDYIGDLYNENSKKVECYVNFQGIPTNEWLRKFYWFNNSLWVLWELKDFNYADPSSVKATFVKVQDVNNYKLDAITDGGVEKIVLNTDYPYIVGHSGATTTGYVYFQGGGSWGTHGGNNGTIYGTDELGNTYTLNNAIRPHTGSGVNTNISVVLPSATAQTDILWDVCVIDALGHDVCTQIRQQGDNSAYVDITEATSDHNATATDIVLHYTERNIESLSVSVDYDGQIQTGWIENVVLNTTNKTITAHLTENMLYRRHAYIVLTGVGVKGDSASDRCQIYQGDGGAADLNVQPQTIDFEFYEGSSTTKEVRITYGGNWTITENN